MRGVAAIPYAHLGTGDPDALIVQSGSPYMLLPGHGVMVSKVVHESVALCGAAVVMMQGKHVAESLTQAHEPDSHPVQRGRSTPIKPFRPGSKATGQASFKFADEYSGEAKVDRPDPVA
jgi:hypothetical protein